MDQLPALRDNEVIDQDGVITSLLPYPSITPDEDRFLLALIEYSGNVGAAYRSVFGDDVAMAVSAGRAILAKPQVALRMKELCNTVELSKEFQKDLHLSELANIRDLAKATGQIKVALSAEQARGAVFGLYSEPSAKSGPSVAVQVNLVSKHDHNI